MSYLRSYLKFIIPKSIIKKESNALNIKSNTDLLNSLHHDIICG